MTLDAGLHLDIPMASYIEDPAPEPSLSKGGIHDMFYKCPAVVRYNHPRLNPSRPRDDSDPADMGSAIHAEILGTQPPSFGEFNDFRKKEAQEWRDGIREAGGIPLLTKHKPQVMGAANAARAALDAYPGLVESERQVEGTMIWQTGKTWNRGRFDLWYPKANKIIDIKTTQSAEPGAWIRGQLSGQGYDIQCEHYLAGMRALGIANEHTDFLFLLVEVDPPHCTAFVGLSPDWSDLAKRKIKLATRRWEKCLAENKWPGYPAVPHWADAPEWQLADLAMKEMLDKAEIGEKTTGLL